jgi:hypothetical protein
MNRRKKLAKFVFRFVKNLKNNRLMVLLIKPLDIRCKFAETRLKNTGFSDLFNVTFVSTF